MFNPGMKLVCIDDAFPSWVKVIYKQLPKKGIVYTLRAFSDEGVTDINTITENDDKSLLFKGNRTYVVWLNEIVNPIHPKSGKEMGFNAKRFAPLENISLETFTTKVISNPVTVPATPKPELVPA